MYKKLQRVLIDYAQVFAEINSSPLAIITKGIRFRLTVYGAPKKLIVSKSIDI